MADLEGAAFDRQYVNQQLGDHGTTPLLKTIAIRSLFILMCSSTIIWPNDLTPGLAACWAASSPNATSLRLP
jgi:hypothetical protein